jgi:hypothetical protein
MNSFLEARGVKGQKMWGENFGKKLLEERLKSRGVEDMESSPTREPEIKEEVRSRHSSREHERKEEKSRSRHDERSEHKRHHREDERSEHKRHHREDEHKSRTKPSFRELEISEQKNRMKAIRKILRQRNSSDQIEAARQRYFERRESGLIVPAV